MNQSSKQKNAKACRKTYYDYQALLPALKTIWLHRDELYRKRLKAALPEWVPAYEAEYGLPNDEIRGQLLNLSPSQTTSKVKP